MPMGSEMGRICESPTHAICFYSVRRGRLPPNELLVCFLLGRVLFQRVLSLEHYNFNSLTEAMDALRRVQVHQRNRFDV